MSRYNNVEGELKNSVVFCNNIGFGEQGAVASSLPKSLFICSDTEKARKMKAQIEALGRQTILVDEFNKPFTLSKFNSLGSKIDILNLLYSLCFEDKIIISTPQILTETLIDLKLFKENVISLSKNTDYDIQKLEKDLIKIGYKKVESITQPGEFAKRGDIIDIFNTVDNNPTRLDFFDTTIDEIYTFDYLTFEKKEQKTKLDIIPNSLMLFSKKEKYNLILELGKLKKDNEIFLDLISTIERDEDVPLEFLKPFSASIKTILDFNIPILISDSIEFEAVYNRNLKSVKDILTSSLNSKLYNTVDYLTEIDDLYAKFNKNLAFFNNFDANTTDLKTKFKKVININFNCVNFPSFINNLEKLQLTLSKFKDKKLYLCLNSLDTLNSIKSVFTATNTSFSLNKNSTGIILTDLKIPFNICFENDDIFYIGSTNFAHKKEFSGEKKTTIKYLPKAGEYVVHSTHGIGKCEGLVTINTLGVDKEFFKIIYRDGDTLYVPYENADTLSLYLAEGEGVHLNKLGGKEFALQKIRAEKSIEDMSKELLELYAKRKATKGYKYPEDDYLYTEFENAFDFEETFDQLQAIQDIKQDMTTGKVMDRLICGDVGFGKTEVAMRALFKAVEAGKQVAILAPTTILSLQHYMTASKRTKDFGVRVEMLNRFKSAKEQKEILKDLKSGKVNVICGTHRLLSKDVEFNDLGLLILDEEQRFGVKAKEQIKQMKNNIDVLTLSATPIPRTLSMSLMTIRDISIINTPPINRLPVKTYVLAYNDDIIARAINDEINRGGQVLVVYNNIEKIYGFANKLKEQVSNERAHFDVAHGQMTEMALENAVKRLYDKETNVFVSTTLIENGVDLPKANTLIVIDSDRLGLSQMYQLRGRVGRSDDQAYAYFTYSKNKTLTEDASNRLQAIAENTELGSGFKIAMRDLQIRGAGELLGKTQHGHMLKIGYDLYTKLLNDTLRKLKGEKVDVEREVKIDIAITSKIPYYFIEEESERLKIIAKLSNITSKDKARSTLSDLINEYGKLPPEIYNLANISLLKAMAIKEKAKQIIINKNKMSIIFYEDIDLNKLMNKVKKYSHFKFENSTLPTISVNTSDFSVQTAMNYFIEFLCN